MKQFHTIEIRWFWSEKTASPALKYELEEWTDRVMDSPWESRIDHYFLPALEHQIGLKWREKFIEWKERYDTKQTELGELECWRKFIVMHVPNDKKYADSEDWFSVKKMRKMKSFDFDDFHARCEWCEIQTKDVNVFSVALEMDLDGQQADQYLTPFVKLAKEVLPKRSFLDQGETKSYPEYLFALAKG